LSIEATIVGPFTCVILKEVEFEDFFYLTLGQNLISFPILTKKKRQLKESVGGGRKGFRKTDL